MAISLTAYGLFTIATVQAVLIAFQHRRLHEHQPLGGLLRGLPPLQTMEALLFEFIGAGFVLLSLALLTGFLFVRDLWGQQLVHKTFFAILGWTVYAILLLGRVRFGWRGPTAIRFAIGGFAFLALAYWGSKLALEVILQ
ncbi:MAG: hypothetical protein KatS3mg124_0933 [Porticoccaceae bacterium]|nr:MAG: hypothetical protein KatS3mg124_0933 [Porticoccaceae bacterium]